MNLNMSFQNTYNAILITLLIVENHNTGALWLTDDVGDGNDTVNP